MQLVKSSIQVLPLLTRLLVLVVLGMSSHAKAFQIEGVGLAEPFTMPIVFEDQAAFLVTASQSHGNYKISLVAENGNSLKTADFTSGKGYLEILLVERGDCVNCSIEIAGSQIVDRSAPYEIEIRSIFKDDEDQNFESWLGALRLLSQAAMLRGNAENTAHAASERDSYLQQTALALEEALSIVPEDTSYAWRLHIMGLLAETSFYLKDDVRNSELLSAIIKETEGQNSPFRAQAFYELALPEKNAQRELGFYDEGMRIASEIGSEVLYAQGANYKAVHLVDERRYADALDLLNQAYKILTREQAWRNLFDPLHNLSWASMRAGDLPQSIAYATEQRLFAEGFEDEENTLWAIYNLGIAYSQLGERYIADQYVEEALTRFRKMPVRSRTSLANLRGFLLQDATEKNLKYGAFDLAADYAEEMHAVFLEQNWKKRIADADFIAAKIHLAKNELSQARSRLSMALDYDRVNERTASMITRLDMLALLEIQEKNFLKSATHVKEALSLVKHTDDLQLLGRLLNRCIRLLVEMGAIQKAKRVAEKAQELVERHGLDEDLATFAFQKARIELAVGNPDEAKFSLEKSREIIDGALPKLKQPDLKRSFLALKKSVFELNIQLLLESGSSERNREALFLAEDYKARTLEEAILRYRGSNPSSMHLKQRRNQLLREVELLSKAWHGLADNRIVSMQQIRKVADDLAKIEAKIVNLSPSPSSLFRSGSEELIKVARRELILYFFVGQRKSWMWGLTTEGIVAFDLPEEAILSSMVQEVVDTYSTPPAARSGINAWDQKGLLKDLSKVLLEDLEDTLDLSKFDLITIVPDGPLHMLPFSALNRPGREGAYLVEEFLLSQAPSLAVKTSLQRRSINQPLDARSPVLIIADPTISSPSDLQPLTHSLKEASALEQYFSGQVVKLTGVDATKVSLVEGLSTSPRILHFATHGLINSEEPSLSGLMFSDPEGGSGMWVTPEIRNANIQAKLVVLSACESTKGRYVAGEGSMSLSRAFLEAGVQQVIGTSWKVQDEASVLMMNNFYEFLIDMQEPPIKALRHAQISMLQNKTFDLSDPYYWANYQLQGGAIESNG